MRRFIGMTSLSALVLTMPALASAVGLLDTLVTVNRFLNGLIGIIITIAIIVFFWGLVQYLTSASEEKKKGLETMFFGLIAIFVMVSVWGIIHLLQYTFGIQGANQAIIPDVVPSGYNINR